MSYSDRGLNFVIQAWYYSLHFQAMVHADCFVLNVNGGFSKCSSLLYVVGCKLWIFKILHQILFLNLYRKLISALYFSRVSDLYRA